MILGITVITAVFTGAILLVNKLDAKAEVDCKKLNKNRDECTKAGCEYIYPEDGMGECKTKVVKKDDKAGKKEETKNDTGKSSLKWDKPAQGLNFADAKAKCENSGMRLPTIAELQEAAASGVAKGWANAKQEGRIGLFLSSEMESDTHVKAWSFDNKIVRKQETNLPFVKHVCVK
jgi:formylglycine-generating enzyme required for sulfatase activity